MAHIHLDFHASFDDATNSVWLHAYVRERVTGEDGVTVTREYHDDMRELLWEEGKEISLSCSMTKALTRFSEACSWRTFAF